MSRHRPLADIKFIADFAVFCRGKGDERYDYDDSVGCAVWQFLNDTGRSNGEAIGNLFYINQHGKRMCRIPQGVSRAADSHPYTFSALADRLEALIADAPVVITV